jgi:hypothetical protein
MQRDGQEHSILQETKVLVLVGVSGRNAVCELKIRVAALL